MELLSEEEQWERLKAWLRTNGPSVLLLTAVLLLGFFGLRWWKDHQTRQAVDAGTLYERIMQTFDAGRREEALALIETLRSKHADSPYVAGTELVAAHQLVANNELDKAEQYLRRVAESASDEALRPIARLRLARVQSAQGRYDEALATLGTADMGPHEPARLEARGDVLLTRGDRAGALSEYLSARRLLPPVELGDGGVGELLDLKIADLGGAAAAHTAEEPAAGADAQP